MGSEAHEKVIRILSEKILLVGSEQMTEQVNITMLEVFHTIKIGYQPKRCVLALTK